MCIIPAKKAKENRKSLQQDFQFGTPERIEDKENAFRTPTHSRTEQAMINKGC